MTTPAEPEPYQMNAAEWEAFKAAELQKTADGMRARAARGGSPFWSDGLTSDDDEAS